MNRSALLRIALLPWLCGILAGCASTGSEALRPGDPRDLEHAVRRRGLQPERIIFPSRLSEEMRAWVRERVPVEAATRRKAQILLEALVGTDGLQLGYRSDYTGTAEEVFATREANCLSFTQIFVAMAREVGVPAYYLSLQRTPRYDREGDLVVIWEHVTAAFGEAPERVILEFALSPTLKFEAAEQLSDLTALAMYYSNRGAELLLKGENAGAREWLETAAILDPAWPHAWLNLGVARRRTGDLHGAETAYRRAIAAGPDQLEALSNLAALLRLRGEKDAAGEVLGLLARRRNRDPFIHLVLGDAELEANRPGEARRFYRRAVALAPREPEALAAMGSWAFAAGERAKAERWLRRAERLEPENPRVLALRRALEGSGPAGG